MPNKIHYSESEIRRYYRDRIPALKQQGKQWRGICPIHRGKHDSFAVEASTGNWHCHSKCGCGGGMVTLEMKLAKTDFATARTAIERFIGRTPTNDNGKRSIVAEYIYRNEKGAPLFRVRRTNPKGFYQQRFENGQWTNRLGSVRRVLYRLPELLAASPDQTVFIAEGEKDVEALSTRGMVATCNPGGAGKWRDEFNDAFTDFHVVILPDADKVGVQHGQQVARSVSCKAATVRVVALPGAKDAAEWFEQGHTVNELRDLAAGNPVYDPESDSRTELRSAPGSPLDDEDDDLKNNTEPFPEVAWRGPFAEYRDAVRNTTEASDAAHFASLLAVVATILGRRVSYHLGRPLYPNVYVVIYGPSGDRKTTAQRLAQDLLPEDVAIKSGVGTPEGFAACLKDKEEFLLAFEEFSTLLAIGHWKNSTLLDFIIEAFDCPLEWSRSYKNSPISLARPTPNIIAGTTPTSFWKNAQDSDFASGFGNRFLFFTGKRKLPMPRPAKPNQTTLQKVRELLDRLMAIPSTEPIELHLNKQASAVWDQFYSDQYEEQGADTLQAIAKKRIEIYALKIAMIYATCENTTPEITLEQLEAAIAVAKYCARCVEILIDKRSSITQTEKPEVEVEKRILDFVEPDPNRPRVSYTKQTCARSSAG